MRLLFASPWTPKALPAVAWLCLTLAAPAQDALEKANASNTVALKERPQEEKALNTLRSKWTTYYLDAAAQSPVSGFESVQPPALLMSPEQEKKLESTLTAPRRQSLARTSKATYVEPDVRRAKGGKLKVTLEAGYAHNHIGTDPVYLRCLNGKLVAPTLRVKPGDKLLITLKNTMQGERWLPHMMNTINSFNTTNMHYHGLHVSPNGISDNVLIQVGPQETQEYEIDIPKDHTPGTYWYHPHRHGSTAGNVSSSMSGALIIEGGLDDIPEIKAAKERVMVLNQIPYLYKNTLNDPNSKAKPPAKVTFDLKEGVIEAKYADYIFGPRDWEPLGRYTTVNGVQLPVIRMRPGQVERWRLVASGQRETLMLKLIPSPKAGVEPPPPIPFHEIAVDGLALGKIIETPTIELWPGYRSDVLVQAPLAGGEYLLIDDAASGTATINGQQEPLNYIARIIIEGKPQEMKLPKNSKEIEDLRLTSIKDSEITGQQEAKYGILLVGEGDKQTAVFTIDGKSFDMETARTLKLNDVDEWTLHSINDVGLVTHPFHIHVNPFEVTSLMSPVIGPDGKVVMVDGKPKLKEELKNGAVWRDTVKIPGGGYVKMRTRYTDFIGTFVQHCHILDHEDQGMMQLIDIVDPQVAAAAAAATVPGVGSGAPDFTLPDAEGKSHSLVDFQGKPTVVFFFKGHGCLHCAQQVSAFAEHYDSFVKKGIQVVGITSDSVADLKTALSTFPCPFPMLADPQGTAFAKFGCATAGGLQHGTFALDAQRQVTWRTVGSSPYLNVKELAQVPAPRAAAASSASARVKQATASPKAEVAKK